MFTSSRSCRWCSHIVRRRRIITLFTNRKPCARPRGLSGSPSAVMLRRFQVPPHDVLSSLPTQQRSTNGVPPRPRHQHQKRPTDSRDSRLDGDDVACDSSTPRQGERDHPLRGLRVPAGKRVPRTAFRARSLLLRSAAADSIEPLVVLCPWSTMQRRSGACGRGSARGKLIRPRPEQVGHPFASMPLSRLRSPARHSKMTCLSYAGQSMLLRLGSGRSIGRVMFAMEAASGSFRCWQWHR